MFSGHVTLSCRLLFTRIHECNVYLRDASAASTLLTVRVAAAAARAPLGECLSE